MDNFMNDVQYKTLLVMEIRPLFESHVIPANVLSIFHKYNKKVLTMRDIEEIRAISNNKGAYDASNSLLDLIARYENWFDCLLNVLQDPAVKLAHIADEFKRMKDKLDEGFKKQKRGERLSNELIEIVPTQESLPMTRGELADSRGLNPLNPSFSFSRHTLDSDNPNTVSHINHADQSAKEIADSYITVTDYPPSSELETGRAGRAINRSFSASGFTGQAESRDKKVKVISDIPERDFTEEEVAGALSHLNGWHPNIQDRQVLQLLRQNIAEPGLYILWFWSNKRRPAICVTHEGEVKTLIIHKRPDVRDPTKVDYYFINKAEYTSKTVADIVDYHLKNGVKDLSKKHSNDKIYFVRPIRYIH